jgi:acyl transferase domain-containing protein
MIDPQHRIFLECCWEAFAHAGYVPGRNCTGVYASCAPSVYALEAMEAGELSDDLRRGTDKDYLPAFVSQTLGLVGPSIAIQSACASAIAAIHVACQSLIAGECDMAIAGAVCALGAADTRKDIHALTTVGDGAGAFLLKPLGRAEEDGDYVHATILGSALAHSGSRLQPGIADSSIVRHVQRSALAAADIDRNQVDYVEMHCSGPEAADSIELAALRAAYRSDQRLPEFGSCRKDVAYAGVASGIAGFLHAIEWVGKRPRPPGPDDGNTAKDQIDLRSRPRIAAVNAIGMTGTHGHLIVSQAPSRNAPMAGAAGEFHAILLSARTSSGLARLAGMLAGYCCGIGDDLPIADIACTLMIGREQFAVRAVSLCRDAHELLTDLGAIAAGRFDRERALRAADAPAELVATARRWLSSDTAAWPLPQRRQRRLPLPWPPLERQPFHRIFGAGVV